MSLTLPGEYTWGFVVGQIIQAIADTTVDGDRLPDARAASGTIRFEPVEKLRKVVNTPSAFVAHEPVVATLGPTGELTDVNGLVGIWLVTGTYQVSFSVSGVTLPGFPIEVTAQHTVESPLDLVTVSPYVAPSGTTVTTLIVPAGAYDGASLGWGSSGLEWRPPTTSTYLQMTEPAGPAIWFQTNELGQVIDIRTVDA